MKKVLLILLVVSQGHSKTKFVSRAVLEVVKNHFIKNSVRFDFVSFSQSENEIIFDDVLTHTAMPHMIVKKYENDTYEQHQSTIFHFDSFQSYWKFDHNQTRYTNFGPVVINNLVFCLNSSAQEIENEAQAFQKSNERKGSFTGLSQRGGAAEALHMTSFLLEEKGQITLKTLSMFTPQLCGVLQLVEINIFSKKTLKWKTEKFFTDVINNFHGCHLNFGVPEHRLPETDYNQPDGSKSEPDEIQYSIDSNEEIELVPPGIQRFPDNFFARNNNKTYPVDGYLIKMVEALTSNLNFKTVYIPVDSRNFVGLKSIIIDYLLTAEVCDLSVFSKVFATQPTFQDFYSLIVPPGASYSPLEKLFLPFDSYVWILFVTTFLIAYFVVFCIVFFSVRKVAKYVVGDHVTAPGLNIFMIFMGGGMVRLPKQNFPRTLTMIFVLYCLIMRYYIKNIYEIK